MAQKTYRVELTNKELSYLLRLMPVPTYPSALRAKLGQAYLSKQAVA